MKKFKSIKMHFYRNRVFVYPLTMHKAMSCIPKNLTLFLDVLEKVLVLLYSGLCPVSLKGV